MVPFCPCMHKPDYEGGKPMGVLTLTWHRAEYEVLDLGQAYARVSEHRRCCGLQADLLDSPGAHAVNGRTDGGRG